MPVVANGEDLSKLGSSLYDPAQALPVTKPSLGDGRIADLDPGKDEIWQAKLDGGFLYYLFDPAGVRAFSWRRSSRTGEPIEHTLKIHGLSDVKVPEWLHGAVLSGEAWHPSLAAREIGGILNTRSQPQVGSLRGALHGVEKMPGVDVTKLTGHEKIRILKRIADELKVFDLPDMAVDKADKAALLAKIKSGKHPQTKEGLVIVPRGGPTYKAVFSPTHDVPVVGVSKGLGKYTSRGIGALLVGPPENPTYVGTGLSDRMREVLHKDPSLLNGLVAKIEAKEVFPSGKFRAPSFKGFHPEKSDPDALARIEIALDAENYKRAAEFAPGIPEDKKIHPVPKSSGTWELTVHRHLAHKAGEHFDLRLADPETGRAHSWALPKASLPDDSKRVRLAVEQPTHTMEYMDFEGEIPEGYGAGRVELAHRGKSTVDADADRVAFTVPGKGEFVLRRQDNKQWLLIKKASRSILATPGEFSKHANAAALLASLAASPFVGAASGLYHDQYSSPITSGLSGGAGGAVGGLLGAGGGAAALGLINLLGGNPQNAGALASAASIGALLGALYGGRASAGTAVAKSGISQEVLLKSILDEIRQGRAIPQRRADLLR